MSGFDRWIQVIATIVALLGVVVSWVYTARQQQRDARSAAASRRAAEQDRLASAASAERAERASALSIDTLERIAGALERIAAAPAVAGPGQEARSSPQHPVASDAAPDRDPREPGGTVAWRLEADHEGRATLTNIGDASAVDVRVSTDPTLTVSGADQPDALGPGGALRFRAVPDAATRDRTVTVSWRAAPDGERRTWRYPLLLGDAVGDSGSGSTTGAASHVPTRNEDAPGSSA